MVGNGMKRNETKRNTHLYEMLGRLKVPNASLDMAGVMLAVGGEENRKLSCRMASHFILAFHWGYDKYMCYVSFELKEKLVHYHCHYNTSAPGKDNDLKTHTHLSLLLPLLLYE